jgi:DNA primase
MSGLGDILERVDLEEWLDFHGLDHRRTAGGDNLQIRVCPACGDERWRLYMHREKKLGMCFHAECRKKFNLFTFARAHLEADARGAARHFEDYAQRVMRLAPRAVPTPAPRVCEGDLVLPDSVALPTPEGHTHPYLLERRVLPATQTAFGLRWCEDASWAYEDVEGRDRRMWFGKRILLPVHDLDGRARTFVGRDASGSAQLRYLFPPLLPSAARFLYGAHLVGDAEHLVIGEGPFDVIAIHQALDHPDFRRCAALGSFGLSLGHGDPQGDDQLGRLLRLRRAGARLVTMLWDGERGALSQALEAAELLARHGLPTRIGLLPAGRDPGELDTGAIRRALAEARPYDAALRVRLTLNSPYD